MEFLTQQKIVRVPADRVKALILTIKTILSQTQVSTRTFLSLLGKLSVAADLILLDRLHLRPLQMCLLSVWKPHILPLDHQVPITRMIKCHLKWWMNSNRFVQGMPIHPPDPEIYLYTDASHFVWGAHLEPMSLSFHGRWSEDQSRLHINMLEIMAIRFALIKALKYIRHSCVMISTDNTKVVSSQQARGNTFSQPMRTGTENSPMVPETSYCRQDSSYPRQIQCFGRQVIENRQSSQNRVGIGSIDSECNFPNVQLSQSGSVCDSLQSQTATLCSPSSGQSSFRDRRISHELELSSCLRLSPNNADSFCTEQDAPISVQNSYDSPSLAKASMVLRGPTTTCLSSSSSSSCSKPIN